MVNAPPPGREAKGGPDLRYQPMRPKSALLFNRTWRGNRGPIAVSCPKDTLTPDPRSYRGDGPVTGLIRWVRLRLSRGLRCRMPGDATGPAAAATRLVLSDKP